MGKRSREEIERDGYLLRDGRSEVGKRGLPRVGQPAESVWREEEDRQHVHERNGSFRCKDHIAQYSSACTTTTENIVTCTRHDDENGKQHDREGRGLVDSVQYEQSGTPQQVVATHRSSLLQHAALKQQTQQQQHTEENTSTAVVFQGHDEGGAYMMANMYYIDANKLLEELYIERESRR